MSLRLLFAQYTFGSPSCQAGIENMNSLSSADKSRKIIHIDFIKISRVNVYVRVKRGIVGCFEEIQQLHSTYFATCVQRLLKCY